MYLPWSLDTILSDLEEVITGSKVKGGSIPNRMSARWQIAIRSCH